MAEGLAQHGASLNGFCARLVMRGVGFEIGRGIDRFQDLIRGQYATTQSLQRYICISGLVGLLTHSFLAHHSSG